MFLFVSRQQTSPCELQLAWWEYMKILTSCPVVCSLPRHSRSLYRAGWPARRKSGWTAQSSAREKNNRGIILFVLLRKKWASKMTMIECGKLWASWSGTKHYVVIILTDAGTVIWFNIGWNEIVFHHNFRFRYYCVHLTCGGQDLLCRESLQQYSTSL